MYGPMRPLTKSMGRTAAITVRAEAMLTAPMPAPVPSPARIPRVSPVQ